MSSALRLDPAHTPACPPPALHPGFRELLKAHESARQMNLPPWEFAVTLGGLLRTGLTETDLRVLALRGQLLHRLEKAAPLDGLRQFEDPSPLAFTERSCFLLTEGGVAFLLTLQEGEAKPGLLPDRPDSTPGLVPHWDDRRRELRLGPHLILRFERPAPNREAVLREFQANRWVRRIANPLKAGSGRMAKLRLQSTIKDLNRCRQSHLIAFGGDGTGQGVLWQMLL
jgi:hypothetical protein